VRCKLWKFLLTGVEFCCIINVDIEIGFGETLHGETTF